MKQTIKAAFTATIPVMAGYLVLGFGFGIIMHACGFSMALAQRPGALAHFGSLSETEQQALINRAHGVDSEQEMRALVERMMT